MDLTDLHPGYVVAKRARFRFITVIAFDTKMCHGCGKYLHRKTKCIRKDKAAIPLYHLCEICTDKEIESYDKAE